MEGDSNSALIEINRAQQALERANDIHEILDLRDKAAALQLFANAQGFREAAQEAKIYQLKAERKAGEWLEKNVRPGNPQLLQDETIRQLPDGIERIESHRWQLEAKVPEDEFNNWVDECLTTGKEISASGLQRLGRLFIEPKEIVELPNDKYKVVYADPPWKYGDEFAIQGYKVSAAMHYPTMSLDELIELPVRDLTQDDAVLFLWATAPMLPEAFELASCWGFEYKAQFIWDKVKHNFGHYNSVRHELLLICTRGSCLPDNSELIDSVQTIERTDHSSKPEEFRNIIDRLYPEGKRIELFARNKADGWEVWGNDVR